MQQHFNSKIAKEYGISEAVVLEHFRLLKQTNPYFQEERYLQHNTVRVITAVHPYFKESKIRAILNKLVRKKILFTGVFGREKNVKCYGLTEKGIIILQKN